MSPSSPVRRVSRFDWSTFLGGRVAEGAVCYVVEVGAASPIGEGPGCLPEDAWRCTRQFCTELCSSKLPLGSLPSLLLQELPAIHVGQEVTAPSATSSTAGGRGLCLCCQPSCLLPSPWEPFIPHSQVRASAHLATTLREHFCILSKMTPEEASLWPQYSLWFPRNAIPAPCWSRASPRSPFRI